MDSSKSSSDDERDSRQQGLGCGVFSMASPSSVSSSSSSSVAAMTTTTTASSLSSSSHRGGITNIRNKVNVHVEVQMKSSCRKSREYVGQLALDYLKTLPVFTASILIIPQDLELSQCVGKLQVADCLGDQSVSFWQANLLIHTFSMSEQEPDKDYIEGEESLPACEQWELPNKYLDGLWESIVAPPHIKNQMIGYCDTSVRFSDANVDSNIITWNRMALLYGPPGTGKTTICKALAQKLFIRHCDRYSSGVLLEINSHSLFSKWFSESGKLVMKLFEHISDIASDEDTLVVVLIDEVESITGARSSAMKSNEPGDAVRVVNAVLTSLDALRRRKNVLVLCTSNMISSIDSAFKDRLDLQIYLGPPSVEARYAILSSCLSELMLRGIIQPSVELGAYSSVVSSAPSLVPISSQLPSHQLYQIAKLVEGYSGRRLRKLPLQAHAVYLPHPIVSFEEFVWALGQFIQQSQTDSNNLFES